MGDIWPTLGPPYPLGLHDIPESMFLAANSSLQLLSRPHCSQDPVPSVTTSYSLDSPSSEFLDTALGLSLLTAAQVKI